MKNRGATNVRTGASSLLLLLVLLFLKADAGNDTLLVPVNFNCACPGEVLTYTCNIAGGGTTLWGGSAFNCPSTSNEIRLRHSQFSSMQGTAGSCNNEAMRARSIGVEDTTCYISELDVTVSSSFNNRIIRCNHDSDSGERVVGMSTLTVVSAPEPPSNVQFIDLRYGQIVLTWTPPESTCARTYYRVISNCSNVTCSSSTNLNTDNCTLPLLLTDILVCNFSVQGEVCGNLLGRLSNPAVVTFQEATVTIIPQYFSNNNTLSRFIVLGSNLKIAKSDSMDIFIVAYNVTFSDPDTGSVIYSAPFSTCGEDTCETDITPPSLAHVCPSSTITVTTDNGLRESGPMTIGCTNQFVTVQYNSAESTISCMFMNSMDTSSKLCVVSYGPCGQEATDTLQGRSTSAIIILSVMTRGSYCYTVTASNDSFTVAVEGMIQGDSDGSTSAAIIGGVVGGLCFIIVIVMLIIIIFIVVRVIKRRKQARTIHLKDIISSDSIKERLKLEVTNQNFKKIEIEKDSKLREAIEYDPKKPMFKQGRAYYEFIHDKENVSEDKELIFMCKDTGEYFSPTVSVGVLYENYLLGEGIRRPEQKKYKVFVQSTGSGARHLPAGSILLYDQVKTWNPEEAPLQPVTSNHFKLKTVTEECSMDTFQKNNDMKIKGANTFVEYSDAVINDIRDVVLMDKKTGKFFTGPTARSNPSRYLDKYQVFVLKRKIETLTLKPGNTILYQNPECIKNKPQFYMLEVNESNVQMAKFVEEKLGKFENGKAFYEFTETEDLLFYKDVVVMPKSSSVNTKQVDGMTIISDFKSSMRRFYGLSSSVPGIGIEPQKSRWQKQDYRVFVQSTSEGSRCLKANTVLLYKF